VAAVALPALVLLVSICVLQVRREQSEVRQRALRTARATARRMREVRMESQALLARLASRPAIMAFDPAACRSDFSVVDFLPRYADVFLFDSSGKLVCSGNTQAENERVSALARQWVETEMRAGRLHAGVAYEQTFAGQPMIMLVAPVQGSGGTIVLLELMSVIGRDALIPGSVITVLDRRGTIVVRSDAPDVWSGQDAGQSAIAVLSSGANEGVADAPGIDGVRRQYGFVKLPDLGWTVYVGVESAEILEPVREMLVNGAVGTVAILLVVIAMSMALARRIGRPIHALADAATVDDGTYERVAVVEDPLELATLTSAFNRMIDRREVADTRMRSGERKLQALSDFLLTVQEEERSRIARELHDDLGQSLTALKMDIIGLLNAASPPPALAATRDRILQTLDATVAAVQQISSQLRPSVLDDLGLVAAIDAEARLFEERWGIECAVSVTGDVQLDRDRVTTIYRIVQEALTNIARHSNATRAELWLVNSGDELQVEICDDGRGVTEEEISDPLSLGLIGIRERAALAGGTVTFSGEPGRGTVISARFPLPAKMRSA
jgi:signal transduction histidine kinase